MKKVLIIILLFIVGCQVQPKKKKYVSLYGTPFAPKMTQEQLEEIRFCAMWEMWAQAQLRHYEDEK